MQGQCLGQVGDAGSVSGAGQVIDAGSVSGTGVGAGSGPCGAHKLSSRVELCPM